MRYWEIIADKLGASGLSWGCSSEIDSTGRELFTVDGVQVTRSSTHYPVQGRGRRRKSDGKTLTTNSSLSEPCGCVGSTVTTTTPKSNGPGANQQQHGDTEQSNCTQAQQPILSPVARYKSAKYQSGNGNHKSTHNGVGFLAWVVAAAAVAQFVAMIVQAHYMRRGLRVTAVAADAAKKSADAATKAADSVLITERAIVLIDTVYLNSETLIPNSTVLFTLKNLVKQ